MIPENLKYSNDHEWLKVDGEFAYVGITQYAADQLGDIVFVDVTSVGETLEQNEVFGSVEAVKTVSDLLLPVGGEVIEFNEKLESNPELINADCYGEAWMVKIRPTNMEEVEQLMNAEQYADMIK